MAEQKAAAAPAKTKGGMKKILMIVGVVALVGGAFVGGTLMNKGSKAEAGEPSVEEEIAEDATGGHGEAPKKSGGHGEAAAGSEATGSAADLIYDFGKDFTVNLLDPSGRQFVRVMIQLKASSADAKTEIEANVAPLRDATISLLSSKTREELQSPSGKDRLKRELLARYDGVLEPHSVEDIYITDLVLMRQ